MRPTPDLQHARGEADPAGADSPAAHEILRRFHALPDGRLELLRQCAAVALDAGCDLYWVGGGVRDLWLGTSEFDIDLLVDGEMATFAALLAATFGSELRLHPEFLTAELLAPGGCRVDLAQVRTESYAAPAALPQVTPGTLASDFARRDFTINCLAIPLAPSFGDRLLDPCGGVADLERRCLRALHAASFRDDPTRILRGLEFEARFEFELETETRRQIERTIAEGRVALLSAARLREALSRALARGRTAARVLRRMRQLALSPAIDSSLVGTTGAESLLESALEAFGRVAGRSLSPAFRLSLLCLAKELEVGDRRRLAQRLALPAADATLLDEGPGRIRAAMALLAGSPVASDAHASLSCLSDEELALVAAGGEAQLGWVRRELDELRGLRLRIGGRDLLAAGASEGAAIGRALAETLAARLDGRISAAEELTFASAVAATAAGEGRE